MQLDKVLWISGVSLVTAFAVYSIFLTGNEKEDHMDHKRKKTGRRWCDCCDFFGRFSKDSKEERRKTVLYQQYTALMKVISSDQKAINQMLEDHLSQLQHAKISADVHASALETVYGTFESKKEASSAAEGDGVAFLCRSAVRKTEVDAETIEKSTCWSEFNALVQRAPELDFDREHTSAEIEDVIHRAVVHHQEVMATAEQLIKLKVGHLEVLLVQRQLTEKRDKEEDSPVFRAVQAERRRIFEGVFGKSKTDAVVACRR